MKLLIITAITMFSVISMWGVMNMDSKTQNLKGQNSQLRRERNMYEKLFRTANTRLSNYQDSINLHCICK